MAPETRYAKSGGVHVAYQTFGDGPVNLAIAPPVVANVEHFCDLPEMSRWLPRLANYARVAIFDRRGTGMSDRPLATLFASTYPERCLALVLYGSFARGVDRARCLSPAP